jgi:hypothetical protein
MILPIFRLPHRSCNHHISTPMGQFEDLPLAAAGYDKWHCGPPSPKIVCEMGQPHQSVLFLGGPMSAR